VFDLNDDRPECTLRSGFGGTCYCTGRPGCVAGDDPDDDPQDDEDYDHD
jgi:hypothetical protein